MPISEPEQRSSDLFHVVGFTEAEVKSGTISRSLEISEEGFKTVAALGKKGSPLWEAAQADRVGKRLIEVYFIETRGSRGNVALAESYGSTRKASQRTAHLSDKRLITQLEVTTSTELSGRGVFSISPFSVVVFDLEFHDCPNVVKT
jgi:hypothetical protein